MPNTKLIWSRLGDALGAHANSSSRRLQVIVCPYIQLGSLDRLLQACPHNAGLQIVTRWTEQDVASGVSDIDIFPWMQRQAIALLINSRIHLKLYVFDDGTAVFGSGNLTNRGMGWGADSNREIAGQANLDDSDWKELYALLDESILVDPSVYEQVAAYKRDHHIDSVALPILRLSRSTRSHFSLLDLPDAEGIDELVAQIVNSKSTGVLPAALGHDIYLLGIDIEKQSDDIRMAALAAYRRLRLIVALTDWLSGERSASFGKVTEWLHDQCAHRPAPYRTEVKRCVTNLFSWLPRAFPGVEITRPVHSEVIKWREAD